MDKITDLSFFVRHLISEGVQSAAFSGGKTEYKKLRIRVLDSARGKLYQFSEFTEKQVFHKNYDVESFSTAFADAFSRYTDFSVICRNNEYNGRISKKGKPLYSVAKGAKQIVAESHDRVKNRLLGDNYPPCFKELGILTEDGKIKNDGYRKYAQINRFIEIINDVFHEKKCAEIVDFGCGKSYLSFLTYHYFTSIKGEKVNMTGLDLKEDVINNCNALAEKYGYDGLRFYCGDIAEYHFDNSPDLVMWLHACDTATDYAIYGAIRAGAKNIIAVPCCQHEVSHSLRARSLTGLFSYGIIKERVSALITDTIRAKCLEYCGYRVYMMEFVDYAVSPKNLLLRAEFVGVDEHSPRRKAIRSELVEIIDWLGFVPKLPSLLGIVGKE